MTSNWQLTDIPNLTSKVFIVTGGNTGLGLKSVEHLSKNGASVILACRDTNSGLAALKSLKLNEELIDVMALDLTNLASIKTFSSKVMAKYNRLDCLINNAGVVNLEKLQRTPDGHEMHMATNHYGHFALTGLLFQLLISTPNSRVVTLSSGAYKVGEIRFDDMEWQKRSYSRVKAYGDSKLANMLFTYELQRKFELSNATSIAVAAHPGLTATPRQQSIGIGGRLAKCLASDMNTGVAPQLLAATHSKVKGLDFYGPRFGIWGSPKKHQIKGTAQDHSLAKALWTHTEELTQVHF